MLAACSKHLPQIMYNTSIFCTNTVTALHSLLNKVTPLIVSKPTQGARRNELGTPSNAAYLNKVVPQTESKFPKKIDIIVFKAGQGHVSTAKALENEIKKQHPNTHIQQHDFFEHIKGNSLFEEKQGVTADIAYNNTFASGKLAEKLDEHRALETQDEQERGHIWVNKFKQTFQHTKPDMVISTIPIYNETIAKGLAQYNCNTPYTTVFTDYSIYRNGAHNSIQTGSRFAIAPSDAVHDYCQTIGYSQNNVFPIQGLVSNAKEKGLSLEQQNKIKQELGFELDKPIGIILAGGGGNADFISIAQKLPQNNNMQYIFICGKNEKAKAELEKLDTPYKKAIFGFTQNVQNYMDTADFFIGKAGGLSITEAMVKKLPMILLNDKDASPLEKLNVNWLMKQKLCLPLNDCNELEAHVNRLQSQEFKDHLQNKLSVFNGKATEDAVQHLSSIYAR